MEVSDAVFESPASIVFDQADERGCHGEGAHGRHANDAPHLTIAMARTVLVVDDEPTLRETLAEALGRMACAS